jgi:hypothetical protein
MRSVTAWAALVSTAASLAACAEPLRPATPPLLQGATAGSGWFSGGCPAHDWDITAKYPEAHAPQVEARLARDFPAGTPEQALLAALTRQGFKPDIPCDNDATIHRALFNQKGGGLFGPYAAMAQVAWKVDGQDRIVWTKAQLAYQSP